MTKQTIIPAGYRVTITSWENDGDNYKDTIHEGLSKERVNYILELCNLFKSKNRDINCFGNMYEPSRPQMDKAEEAAKRILEKHRAVLDERELANLDSAEGEGEIADMMCDYFGYSEDFTFRVYHRAKVEHIPHQITMEDVTGDFNV